VREARRRAACAERYCTKLKCVSKQLIINEILVEATGVDFLAPFRNCNLLIPKKEESAKRRTQACLSYNYRTNLPAEKRGIIGGLGHDQFQNRKYHLRLVSKFTINCSAPHLGGSPTQNTS
jgi:hypothetical protein